MFDCCTCSIDMPSLDCRSSFGPTNSSFHFEMCWPNTTVCVLNYFHLGHWLLLSDIIKMLLLLMGCLEISSVTQFQIMWLVERFCFVSFCLHWPIHCQTKPTLLINKLHCKLAAQKIEFNLNKLILTVSFLVQRRFEQYSRTLQEYYYQV